MKGSAKGRYGLQFMMELAGHAGHGPVLVDVIAERQGLPANGSLWRTVSMFLLLFGLAAALIGVMSHLFEQVDRRSEEARQAARRKRREGRG